MKKISEIYAEYKIMPNLQMHMLRVAAVASMICDNFDEPLPKEEIITLCLLHDMGNIIKSNFEYFPEFNGPEGKEYWQNVKDEYIKKYGSDEEEAHGKIMEELGLDKRLILLAKRIDFGLACEYCVINDAKMKIVNYADWRVSPYGILSFEGRMEDGKKRYKLKTQADENEREKLIICSKEIEKQIFAKCKIKPEDINDATAEPVISELRKFVVK